MWIHKYVVFLVEKKEGNESQTQQGFYHNWQSDQAHRHLASVWLRAQGADCL